MPYRPSTACEIHSFCIQDRPYLPCSVAIVLQQPTTQPTLHAHQYALHTQHYPPNTTHPTAFNNCPMHTTNPRHSWQNGTRCRDDVEVLWCRSHLVWLVFNGSISTCTCFHSENFIVTLIYLHCFFYTCHTEITGSENGEIKVSRKQVAGNI